MPCLDHASIGGWGASAPLKILSRGCDPQDELKHAGPGLTALVPRHPFWHQGLLLNRGPLPSHWIQRQQGSSRTPVHRECCARDCLATRPGDSHLAKTAQANCHCSLHQDAIDRFPNGDRQDPSSRMKDGVHQDRPPPRRSYALRVTRIQACVLTPLHRANSRAGRPASSPRLHSGGGGLGGEAPSLDCPPIPSSCQAGPPDLRRETPRKVYPEAAAAGPASPTQKPIFYISSASPLC